ncbi:MAG: hypothetical protein ABSE42_10250 [Bryobacteraceae bacterium]
MKRIALVLALLSASRLPAADTSTPPVAQKFLGLFQELRAAGTQRGSTLRHVSFALSDGEIDEYMRYALRTSPRPGVDSVSVKIFPQNYVSTFTVVDFDAVERWKPGTIPALLRPILRGKQSIWVDYRFAAANSTLTFSVEKAYYDNLRLPAFFVGKMIQIVAARQPEHYDTSKPLPLPFGLRQAWTENHIVKGNN